MKKEKKSELSIEAFSRIRKVFYDKKWPVVDDFDDNIFDKFCQMLSTLSDEQSNLIIRLTEDFVWVKENEYIKYFSQSFDTFVNNHCFNNRNNIIICPLLAEDDFGKTKSSTVLLYFVKARLNSIRTKYGSFSINYVESPEYIEKHLPPNGYTLCLIDDFVGTGETAASTIDYLIGKGISTDSIAVVSLVCMKQGSNYLLSKGCRLYSSIECGKGISDAPIDRQVSLRLMETIEKSIGVCDKFRLGYGASEALVKMERTPNNTFPIYWLVNKKNKYAPFPR